MEIPHDQGAPIDQLVDVGVGGHGLEVLARVATRNAERQTVVAHEPHGGHDPVVDALAPARVSGFAVTFHAEGRDEVATGFDRVNELLVKERAVRERQKHAVVVAPAELDDVRLANERLAARVDVEVDPEALTLLDDGVDVGERKVEPVAVVRSPAARAVQVAGARGVEQDCPGDVAADPLAHLLLARPPAESGVEGEVERDMLEVLRVELAERAHEQPVDIGVLVLEILAYDAALRGHRPAGDEVHRIQETRNCLVGIRAEHSERLADAEVRYLLFHHGHLLPLPIHRICDINHICYLHCHSKRKTRQRPMSAALLHKERNS